LSSSGPNAFVFIGNGSTGTRGAVPLHNSSHDFNDAVLPISARYFAEVIERRLSEESF
jgi:metal-dependent amidase/aminoacylase/carboxypeptidase family protein